MTTSIVICLLVKGLTSSNFTFYADTLHNIKLNKIKYVKLFIVILKQTESGERHYEIFEHKILLIIFNSDYVI